MKYLPLLALAACCCAAGCQSGSSQPEKAAVPTATPLRIAYNVYWDAKTDDYEIFSMNLDGSDRRNISNWKGVDWVYASAGDKLYFLSDRDNEHRSYNLYEMDAWGGGIRRINNFVLDDSWPAVRDGGSEFVVTSRKDGQKAFYLIDAQGNELARLFSDTIAFNDACFSPDGSELAFRYQKSGVDEIWVMTLKGGAMRQVSRYPSDEIGENQHFYHAGPPRWEPNRNLISFMSFQDSTYDIYTVCPDGSDLRRLTPHDFNYGWHDWSPDGSQIVYDGSNVKNENYDIYLMNADGTGIRRLTTDSTYEQSPVFVQTPAISQ